MSLGVAATDEGPANIPSVRVLLEEIQQPDKKFVIVASAGNDSGDRTCGTPRAASFPASHPTVIGVAATNRSGQRACFSNAAGPGGVSAPGGDQPRPAEGGCATSDDFDPRIPDMDADRTLISWAVQTPAEFGETPSGFARWKGTSFAAPLVSGLAALLLEAKGGWAHRGYAEPTQTDIQEAIPGRLSR